MSINTGVPSHCCTFGIIGVLALCAACFHRTKKSPISPNDHTQNTCIVSNPQSKQYFFDPVDFLDSADPIRVVCINNRFKFQERGANLQPFDRFSHLVGLVPERVRSSTVFPAMGPAVFTQQSRTIAGYNTWCHTRVEHALIMNTTRRCCLGQNGTKHLCGMGAISSLPSTTATISVDVPTEHQPSETVVCILENMSGGRCKGTTCY